MVVSSCEGKANNQGAKGPSFLCVQWKESIIIMGQIIAGGEQFETHIEADYRGQILQKGPDSGSVDAFGRARVSEPYTLFDSSLRYSKQTNLWYEATTGSASTSYLTNESSLSLIVNTASGDTALRRTKRNMPYQPGKSLMIMQSFCGATPAAGVIQEVGYFDDNNGVMVRASGTTLQFVVRSKASGSVVEDVVNQSSWNINTFSDLNFGKINIFIVDLEWLGVGRVRVGFVIDGEIKWCHEFNHANVNSTVYMTTAILPLSYRIYNETAQLTSHTLKQICCTAISEGGYEPTGPIYLAGRGASNFSAITSETMVAAIRMASGRTDNLILPAQVDVTIGGNPAANAAVQWRLRLNPTISGVWTAADNGRGNVETMASGTCSGGTVIGGGLIAARSDVAFDPSSALALSLGKDASGNSDVIALTIQCSSNQDATGLLGWRELV